jgi:predicted RNA-binding protein YlqC (UPF0109 family)
MFEELAEYIVKALVDYPDQVSVAEIVDGRSVVIEVRVADGDVGRVIGRKGRVINAIRAVIQSVASREGKRVTIEVL